MLLSDVARVCQGELHGQDFECRGVSIDSRDIQPGQLYVAIVGDRFDGHEFVLDAKARGAKAAIVNYPLEANLPQIVVSDTRHALGLLAADHRTHFHIPVIALTGSCGKTTVKEMIASILKQAGPTLASKGNFNNDIGVPLSLLQLDNQYEYAVFELGANHIGEIAYTTSLVRPHVALITNIGTAHIGEFGGQDAIAKAKSEIFQGLDSDGAAIINADDAYAEQFIAQLTHHKIITFGLSHTADITGQVTQVDEQGCAAFTLQQGEQSIDIQLQVPGQHNVLNALAACASVSALNMDLHTMKQGLEKVMPVAGRLQRRQTSSGALIIDDTYNANLKSFTVAIELLAAFQGRRVLVMGDMVELGEENENHHRAIGEVARQYGIDALYTCGQFSQLATESFADAARHFTDKRDLIECLKTELSPQTTLLIKGSRASQMEEVVQGLMI